LMFIPSGSQLSPPAVGIDWLVCVADAPQSAAMKVVLAAPGNGGAGFVGVDELAVEPAELV
jgi:hypothetical protein